MCGIAGCWGLRVEAAAVAKSMAQALRHRGPDDAGVWADADHGIALSHRRLSILDLSPEGHQPMQSADGRYVLVYNGEVYNHAALRRELDAGTSASPVRWRGHSDTEVLLAAISAWGIETTLRRAHGMFAIALWDRSRRELHLIRDRLGEKPLYYGWAGGSFVFGSELKALRECPGFDPTIDRDALALYLRHLYVPAPFSIYRGAHKLEAGCHLTLSGTAVAVPPTGRALRAGYRADGFEIRRWWSLQSTLEDGRNQIIADETQGLDTLERCLRQAVGEQSMADVPLGAFLSGGIDSSLIAAMMKLEVGSAVRTFTIGLEEKDHDEAEHATAVARHLGTQHTVIRVNGADALDVIPRLPKLYDEPFADASQIPTFLLCAHVRKHVTVALSGDGGDELFGGYNRYQWVPKIWRRARYVPGPARRHAARLLAKVPPRRWNGMYSAVRRFLPTRGMVAQPGDKLHKLAKSLEMATDEDSFFFGLVSEWKNPNHIVLGAHESQTLLTQREQQPSFATVQERMMYLDAMTYLPDDIMVKVDRASMGVSLETRAPFLDGRVVEAAARLPLSMKMRAGQGKWALRQLLFRHVPRELVERPKHGFGIPLAAWLRGPLRAWGEELLDEGRLRREGFFRPEPIRERWEQHCAGTRSWEHSLWAILMFQNWLQNQGPSASCT